MTKSKHATNEMSPEDRRREVAAILARGVLRVRNRRLLDREGTFQDHHSSDRTGLDVGRDSSLTVTNG